MVRPQDEWLLMAMDELQARALEERAAGPVLHDLNNLLTALIYEVHTATELARAGKDCLEEMTRVQAALATAASITRGFAAIGRSKATARHEVEVRTQLDALRSVLETVAGAQVALDMRVEGRLARAAIRPDAFDRVVINLVSNAADAVMGTGTIVVSAKRTSVVAGTATSELLPREGEYVLITVEDDGCGMEAEVARRAFEPTYSTKPDGCGIGLAMVAQCVHRRGGAVGLRTVPGVGAAVDVYVPVVSPPD